MIEVQQVLEKRRNDLDNWAYSYWLDEMYMEPRLPLPVNSNPGRSTMEAKMIFKTIRFYDIKSRHGLPKAELQRYWANARLHKVIVILNIITIIMIIIVITAVINWVAQCDQNNQIFL